jgi:hypothetical protein
MAIDVPDSSLAPAPPAGFVRRHRVKLVLMGLVALIGAVTAGYTMVVLNFSYSTGDRVGFVQKLSKKGWICRTWEGELAMSPVPGAAPQLFPFSIRDDEVAKQITALEGKKVSIHYEEKKGIPTSCFGETAHFVTAVRVVAQ